MTLRLRKYKDLQKERNRYNFRASEKIDNYHGNSHNQDVITNESDPIYFSLLEYRRLVLNLVPNGVRVLELGAGMGENSQPLIDLKCELHMLDISEKSLEYAQAKWGSKVKCVKANIENLPFPDSFFDVVVGAGCLSYGDPKKVDSEMYRVLRGGGTIILIDSLNHNPIYRINRFRHFILGNRSFSTIVRIPNIRRIRSYSNSYKNSQTYFFGTYLWLYQLSKFFVGQTKALQLFNYLEGLNYLRRYAFKFVFVGSKRNN
jgi:SAM-dependent methyltransferase